MDERTRGYEGAQELRGQDKDLLWGYLKYTARHITQMKPGDVHWEYTMGQMAGVLDVIDNQRQHQLALDAVERTR